MLSSLAAVSTTVASPSPRSTILNSFNMLAFISAAALAVILPALGAPTGNVPITKFPGQVKANSYIMYVHFPSYPLQNVDQA
jgi:hypothetical protein